MDQICCEAAQTFLLAQRRWQEGAGTWEGQKRQQRALAELLALDKLVLMELSCHVELLRTKRSAEHRNYKILHDIMYLSLSHKDNRFFPTHRHQNCVEVQLLEMSDGTKQKGGF